MTKKMITADISQIEKVITGATVIQLAFAADNRPYLLPFSFGYRDGVLYFHSKKSGKKLDILASNDQVAFALQQDVRLLEKDDPCGYSFVYNSVSGWGKASIIEDIEEKRMALAILAQQYSSQTMACADTALEKVTVFKLVIKEMALKTATLEQPASGKIKRKACYERTLQHYFVWM